MVRLLRSEQISDSTKFLFINSNANATIINRTFNAAFVLEHITSNADLYDINTDLKLDLINKKELSKDQRIILFCKIYSNLTNVQISSFLISLGYPYSDIANKKKNPEIGRNLLNITFMDILMKVGYIRNYSEKNNRIYHSK